MASTITPVTADEYEAELSADAPPAEEGFATEVAEKLGYNRLQTDVVKQTEKMSSMGTLLAVLREHGIAFYRPEDVTSYKESMVRKAERKPWWQLILLAGASLIFLAAGIIGEARGPEASGIAIVGMAAGALGLGLSFPLFFSIEDSYTRAVWGSVPLNRYYEPVPQVALERAMTLRNGLDDARFRIEELSVERGRIVRNWDPLLYVEHGDAELCIAVWDEPEFNAPLAH